MSETAKLAASSIADAGGVAAFSMSVPVAGWNFFLQAVDVDTCTTSNVVQP